MEKVDSIAAAVAQQSRTGQSIAEHVRRIREMAETNNAVTAETLLAVDHVECLAENLREIGNVFKLGPAGEQAVSTHARMPALVRQAALSCGADLRQGVDAGRIKRRRSVRRPLPADSNTRPQKFKTRFDDFTDQNHGAAAGESARNAPMARCTPSASTATAMCRRTTGNSRSR
jgi:methyl-accepting chemotaxis protein